MVSRLKGWGEVNPIILLSSMFELTDLSVFSSGNFNSFESTLILESLRVGFYRRAGYTNEALISSTG